MKTLRPYVVCCIVVILTMILSCTKDDGSGSILVTAKHNGQGLSQATIYLKKGNDTSTVVPLAAFDLMQGADAIGQAYFDNIEPGIYTLFAKGYSQQSNRTVKGKTFVTVRKRFRQNEYDITIETQ